ncbi:unnamed protein product [Cunninghamella blakesleeana]
MADFERALDEYLQVKRQCQNKHKTSSATLNDNNNKVNKNGNGGGNSSLSNTTTTTTATQSYDYERYLYNEERDLWYDTMTFSYYKYNTTSQQYIPVYISSEEEEKDKQTKKDSKNNNNNTVTNVKEDEYDNSSNNRKDNGEPETDACCRLIVLTSKIIEKGLVKLVDANGITIGRDKHLWDERRWRLPDIEVSKYHCQIYYDEDKKCFSLIDVGSQNGTLLNGIRLSEKKISSSPHSLKHGDQIQVGDTLLEFHNHENGWPCEKCQTSAINGNEANNSNNNNNNKSMMNQTLLKKIEGTKKSIDDHQLQRQERLKELKKMAYQQNNDLSSSPSSPSSASFTTTSITPVIIDRAKIRRENNRNYERHQQLQRKKESSDEIETDIVNLNTPVKGKGNDLLKKMGWKQGEALGVNGQGIVEPILPTIQQGRTGIGKSSSTMASVNPSISVKDQNWQKMQNRWME